MRLKGPSRRHDLSRGSQRLRDVLATGRLMVGGIPFVCLPELLGPSTSEMCLPIPAEISAGLCPKWRHCLHTPYMPITRCSNRDCQAGMLCSRYVLFDPL